MLINSPFTFHYRAQNSPCLLIYQKFPFERKHAQKFVPGRYLFRVNESFNLLEITNPKNVTAKQNKLKLWFKLV